MREEPIALDMEMTAAKKKSQQRIFSNRVAVNVRFRFVNATRNVLPKSTTGCQLIGFAADSAPPTTPLPSSSGEADPSSMDGTRFRQRIGMAVTAGIGVGAAARRGNQLHVWPSVLWCHGRIHVALDFQKA
jgi:hypothetical protein